MLKYLLNSGALRAVKGVGRLLSGVAKRMGISPRTVETHLAKLYRKLGARTRVQAVSRAASLGLIDLGYRSTDS